MRADVAQLKQGEVGWDAESDGVSTPVGRNKCQSSAVTAHAEIIRSDPVWIVISVIMYRILVVHVNQ